MSGLVEGSTTFCNTLIKSKPSVRVNGVPLFDVTVNKSTVMADPFKFSCHVLLLSLTIYSLYTTVGSAPDL